MNGHAPKRHGRGRWIVRLLALRADFAHCIRRDIAAAIARLRRLAMNAAPAHPWMAPSDQLREACLQLEIGALREAHACVTDTATPAQVYGRVDDLINRRLAELETLYRMAREAAQAVERG